MKAIALVVFLVGIACVPLGRERRVTIETVQGRDGVWLTMQKESEDDFPDSPEQVLITIRTRDGQKWVATWEPTR